MTIRPFKFNIHLFNDLKESLHCKAIEEQYYVMNFSEPEQVQQLSLLTNEEDDIITELTISITKKNEQSGELVKEQHIFASRFTRETNKQQLVKGLFTCHFISSVDYRLMPVSVNLLNKIIQKGRRDELLKTLQFFDQKIVGLELLMDPAKRTTMYINHLELGIVPINVFGDGLRKALLLASKIIDCENGVLLVDELETGIHTSLIPDFMKWTSELCQQFHVQLFATTHSLEAVDGILSANLADLDTLSFYRLKKKGNVIQSRHFTGEKIKNIRYDFGQDVR